MSVQKQPWDFDRALQNVNGNGAHLRDLLEIWMTQTDDLMDRIRNATRTLDMVTAQQAANTMRSSLHILAADQALEDARKLESLVEEESPARLHGAVESLERHIDELRSSVAAYLEADSV